MTKPSGREERDTRTSKRATTLRDQPIAAQRARNAQLLAQARLIADEAESTRSGEPTPVAVVPANTRETTLLPDSARSAFLENLERALGKAFAPLADADDIGPTAATLAAHQAATDAFGVSPTAEDLILGRSCATCRGECCTAGGNHAFLREDSMRRMREQHPLLDATQLRDAYAARLPERHYRGSCVYHTTEGCHLPRDMRSNLCNRYVCGGLTQLKLAMSAAGSTSVFVAAADSAHLRRMALIDAQSARPISLTTIST